MRFGSVCSGIEAASVAWHPLGWEAAWFSEIEAFPSAVLAHRFPSVPNYGDMTRLADMVDFGVIEAPDVLVGGTPCQAFSVAGRRQGLSDARGQLSLAYVELADAIDRSRAADGRKPAIIVWENVPGVLSSKDNAFGCFLAALVGEDEPLVPAGNKWPNAGAVYGPERAAAWRIVDAQHFGVAQRRRRVFLVASARDDFDPAAVFLECEGVRRDSPPSRETGQGVAVCPTLRAGGNSTGGVRPPDTDVDTADSLQPVAACYGNSRSDGELNVAGTLTANGRRLDFDTEVFAVQPVFAIQERAVCENPNAGPDGAGFRGDGAAYTLEARTVPQAIAFAPETARTLTARYDGSPCHDRGPDVVAFAQNTRDEVRLQGGDGKISGALGANEGMKQRTYLACTDLYNGTVTGDVAATMGTRGSSVNSPGPTLMAFHTNAQPDQMKFDENTSSTLACSQSAGAMIGSQVRRLMPVECERLQGFPDNWTLVPYRNKPAAGGPRYKALGNSMAVPCMNWLARRIKIVLARHPLLQQLVG